MEQAPIPCNKTPAQHIRYLLSQSNTEMNTSWGISECMELCENTLGLRVQARYLDGVVLITYLDGFVLSIPDEPHSFYELDFFNHHFEHVYSFHRIESRVVYTWMDLALDKIPNSDHLSSTYVT